MHSFHSLPENVVRHLGAIVCDGATISIRVKVKRPKKKRRSQSAASVDSTATCTSKTPNYNLNRRVSNHTLLAVNPVLKDIVPHRRGASASSSLTHFENVVTTPPKCRRDDCCKNQSRCRRSNCGDRERSTIRSETSRSQPRSRKNRSQSAISSAPSETLNTSALFPPARIERMNIPSPVTAMGRGASSFSGKSAKSRSSRSRSSKSSKGLSTLHMLMSSSWSDTPLKGCNSRGEDSKEQLLGDCAVDELFPPAKVYTSHDHSSEGSEHVTRSRKTNKLAAPQPQHYMSLY